MKQLFKSEQDATNWIATNITFSIKPKKIAKTKDVYPYTSHNALIQVVEDLGKRLFKHQQENK